MNTLWFLVFVLFQFADVASTYCGFRLGADEWLSLPKFMFARFGYWPSVVMIKGTGIAVAALLTMYVDAAWVFTGLLSLVGVVVLWNNVTVIDSLSKAREQATPNEE